MKIETELPHIKYIHSVEFENLRCSNCFCRNPIPPRMPPPPSGSFFQSTQHLKKHAGLHKASSPMFKSMLLAASTQVLPITLAFYPKTPKEKDKELFKDSIRKACMNMYELPHEKTAKSKKTGWSKSFSEVGTVLYELHDPDKHLEREGRC